MRQPQVFLFDEPLSNLDAKMRVQTRAEISQLHRRLQATIVYVTHDIREAILIGERVAVMTAGPGARIKRVHPVPLPYPRDEDTPEFAALHRHIERDIEEEVTAAWAREGTN